MTKKDSKMPQPMSGTCQSCMMPFTQDPNAKTREHVDYCSYCYVDGNFSYKGDDVKEFKQIIKKEMVKNGVNPVMARVFSFMAGFAPRWKK